jgi:hypothetical protein
LTHFQGRYIINFNLCNPLYFTLCVIYLMYVIYKYSIRNSQRTHCASTGKKINLFKLYGNIITVHFENHEVKVRKGHEGPEGEQRYSSTLSLTSALDGAGWSKPRPSRFTPRKESRYPLYRSLGGPQGRSGRVRKISPPSGIRSPDIPAHSKSLYRLSYRGPSVKMITNT